MKTTIVPLFKISFNSLKFNHRSVFKSSSAIVELTVTYMTVGYRQIHEHMYIIYTYIYVYLCMSKVLYTIYIYIYIYRKFRGVRTHLWLPPVAGRSASFRLCFRFVLCVRSGEAKLCGRVQTVILSAGPPGSQDQRVCAPLGVHVLPADACVLTPSGTFLTNRKLFFDAEAEGLITLTFACFAADEGFKASLQTLVCF